MKYMNKVTNLLVSGQKQLEEAQANGETPSSPEPIDINTNIGIDVKIANSRYPATVIVRRFDNARLSKSVLSERKANLIDDFPKMVSKSISDLGNDKALETNLLNSADKFGFRDVKISRINGGLSIECRPKIVDELHALISPYQKFARLSTGLMIWVDKYRSVKEEKDEIEEKISKFANDHQFQSVKYDSDNGWLFDFNSAVSDKPKKGLVPNILANLNFWVDEACNQANISSDQSLKQKCFPNLLMINFPQSGVVKANFSLNLEFDTLSAVQKYAKAKTLEGENSFGVENYGKFTLKSVLNGLVKGGKLSEKDKTLLLNRVQTSKFLKFDVHHHEQIVNEFLTNFFGESTSFFESGKQDESGLARESFLKTFRHILMSLRTSETIREYLTLAIVVKKYLTSEKDEILVNLVEEAVPYSHFSYRVNQAFEPSFNLNEIKFVSNVEVIETCFKLSNFNPNELESDSNLHNLLIIFHEIGHFICHVLFRDEVTGYSDPMKIINCKIDDLGAKIMRELSNNADNSEADLPQLYKSWKRLWSTQRETLQILGLGMYQNLVFVNKYNDYVLRQAVHSVHPDTRMYLRLSHIWDANQDVSNLNIEAEYEVIKEFFQISLAKVVNNDEDLKSLIDAIVDKLRAGERPKELENFVFETISQLNYTMDDDLKASVKKAIKDADLFTKGPRWSEDFKQLYAKLAKVDLDSLNRDLNHFSLSVLQQTAEDFRESFKKGNFDRIDAYTKSDESSSSDEEDTYLEELPAEGASNEEEKLIYNDGI